MLFAGNAEPLAYLECKSIGLAASQAKSLSASTCQLLSNRLTLPKERIQQLSGRILGMERLNICLSKQALHGNTPYRVNAFLNRQESQ